MNNFRTVNHYLVEKIIPSNVNVLSLNTDFDTMHLLKYFLCGSFLLILLSVANRSYSQTEKNTNEIYSVVDKMPKFPGGDPELLKYIKGSLKYPEKAKEDKIEGIVFVTFVISPKGKVLNPKVVGSVHPLLDDEALRLVKEMPKWEAGMNGEQAVSVQYNLPIRFKLAKKK